MNDEFRTLTSPLSGPGADSPSLLALTILWHPDPARIGEQFVTGAQGTALELSRYGPLFCRPGGDPLPLGHGGLSREPLRVRRDALDNVSLQLPVTRMVVELNGKVVQGDVVLDAAQVGAGQVLALGRAVLLCFHWMDSLPRHNPAPGVSGVGSGALAMRDQIRMVAPTDMPVLLLGETGTGKEIAARAIHALSKRGRAKLVTVNMAALNEALAPADLFGAARGAYTGAQADRKGWFAEADGATLFLDEIGNAPASVQPMLLRVLEGGDYRPLGAAQDQRSTARLIAATDQQLDTAGFNQALLRRLEGFSVALPALRSRREDIGVLILDLLADQAAAMRLSCALVSELACYHWPGNIRQLARALQRAMLILDAGAIPQFAQLVRESAAAPGGAASTGAPAAPGPARRKPGELSEHDILDAMERHAWTIAHAARALGISRPTLYKLLDKHPDIKRAQYIPADEIDRALVASEGDVGRCAALLKTPAEPLRRLLGEREVPCSAGRD
ncbi:sigma 54-interacting transcriptional regulator [Janthinobacterium sp. SUN128]|uniref:Sigma 54-interacting transcriptional regulator n=1 Tax=Janthinobacterium lividum TaxID=29581 RepID=A0AAJ4MY40_9BURK|nr:MULTISPECIES: sigma 54-interacting transcriptional regulator [Janthinobacterium]KAB0324765.1 AAA domain-containing protein [Janthinobacterium lividum]MDO8032762.1 sigma 54-interacting transcriptional regulator [Janthinobacterium sp. SUN128]QSX98876.1 sigma 54-interacting transcriptional regulator [Janthinobacterium lividum]UGQ38851.1 sigma 54-interacting transcriptional regulator [Janthinobacterium sp. PLB04]